MNEQRIRELAKQAGFYPENNWDHTNWHAAGHNPTFEKFAELIVRECTDILMIPEHVMNHHQELTDYYRGWVNGRLLGIEHIKEHFGVEE